MTEGQGCDMPLPLLDASSRVGLDLGCARAANGPSVGGTSLGGTLLPSMSAAGWRATGTQRSTMRRPITRWASQTATCATMVSGEVGSLAVEAVDNLHLPGRVTDMRVYVEADQVGATRLLSFLCKLVKMKGVLYLTSSVADPTG
jgi:hypothetical protein